MKKIMMMALMALMCTAADAQNHRRDGGAITVQPMVGLSYGTLRGEQKTATGTVKYDNDEARFGVGAGVEGEYYFDNGWLTLSAAALYQQEGWKIKDTGAVKGYTSKVDYINIPILANFYVAKGFALKVGVQPGFLINAKSGGTDFKSECKTFSFGIPCGLSYEFANGITLDLRGNYALTKLNKNSDSFKWYVDGGLLTIGYKFSVK